MTKRTLVLLTCALLAGCSQGTPGGPGAADNKPVIGNAENSFTLSVPVLASAVQQGRSTEVTIGIERGKNFQDDVALNFADLPQGTSIEPADPVIKHSEKDVKVTFSATDDAAIGDYTLKLTGHPTKGADAQVDFKLKVAAKDGFTLSLPLLSTSIKQGESKEVKLGITRQKSFDHDVALMIGDLPKGVTMEPKDPIIKSGNAEETVTLTAAPDAALGDFTVKVIGHPTAGADTEGELKLSIVKQ